jgi:hypothetical protein
MGIIRGGLILFPLSACFPGFIRQQIILASSQGGLNMPIGEQSYGEIEQRAKPRNNWRNS